jgi:hypothetical protein
VTAVFIIALILLASLAVILLIIYFATKLEEK